MTNIEDLSREDLLKIMARDRAVKGELAVRIGQLVAENVELMGVLHEMESELSTAREQLAVYQTSE